MGMVMQTPQVELLRRTEAVAGGVGRECRASEHMAKMPIQPPGQEVQGQSGKAQRLTRTGEKSVFRFGGLGFECDFHHVQNLG